MQAPVAGVAWEAMKDSPPSPLTSVKKKVHWGLLEKVMSWDFCATGGRRNREGEACQVEGEERKRKEKDKIARV